VLVDSCLLRSFKVWEPNRSSNWSALHVRAFRTGEPDFHCDLPYRTVSRRSWIGVKFIDIGVTELNLLDIIRYECLCPCEGYWRGGTLPAPLRSHPGSHCEPTLRRPWSSLGSYAGMALTFNRPPSAILASFPIAPESSPPALPARALLAWLT
jgi:hypothetical protein